MYVGTSTEKAVFLFTGKMAWATFWAIVSKTHLVTLFVDYPLLTFTSKRKAQISAFIFTTHLSPSTVLYVASFLQLI
jgi:hypothetical protein